LAPESPERHVGEEKNENIGVVIGVGDGNCGTVLQFNSVVGTEGHYGARFSNAVRNRSANPSVRKIEGLSPQGK
jgi:hypothetical protein